MKIPDFDKMPENELQAWLAAALAPDFYAEREVPGCYHDDPQIRVFADFVVRPKPHLITQDFEDIYFIIETKSNNRNDPEKRYRQIVAQINSYLHCTFEGFGGYPAFGLMFPPMKYILNRASEVEAIRIQGVSRLAQFLGIGEIDFNYAGFAISSHNGRYFSKQYGRSVVNVFRRPVGNFHTKRSKIR